MAGTIALNRGVPVFASGGYILENPIIDEKNVSHNKKNKKKQSALAQNAQRIKKKYDFVKEKYDYAKEKYDYVNDRKKEAKEKIDSAKKYWNIYQDFRQDYKNNTKNKTSGSIINYTYEKFLKKDKDFQSIEKGFNIAKQNKFVNKGIKSFQKTSIVKKTNDKSKDIYNFLGAKSDQLEGKIKGLSDKLPQDIKDIAKLYKEDGLKKAASGIYEKITIKYPKTAKLLNSIKNKTGKLGKYGEKLKNSKFFKGLSKAKDKLQNSKLLKNMDKKLKVFNTVGTVLDIASSDNKREKIMTEGGSAIGGKLGGKVGGNIGAAIGTAIFPGVGTAIGYAVGDMVGSWAGSKLGRVLGKTASDFIQDPKKTVKKLFKSGKKLVGKAKDYIMHPEKAGKAILKSGKKFVSNIGNKLFGTKKKATKTIKKVIGNTGKVVKKFAKLPLKGLNKLKKTAGKIGKKVYKRFSNSFIGKKAKQFARSKTVKRLKRGFSAFGRKLLSPFRRKSKKRKRTSWFSRIGRWWSRRRNAEGSIINNKALSWVGEEGPEAIIPLNSTRRQRGTELWKRAGRILGMDTEPKKSFTGRNMQLISGDNSTPGKSNAGEGGAKNIQVNVGGVTIQVKAGGEGGSLLDMIETQKEEIANAISGIIAEALEDGFENIPLSVA